MESINKKQIEVISQFLTQKLSPYIIMLFGSAAKDRMRSDSDIDIAFLSDTKLGNYDLFMIASELADLLGRDVDLIDLNNASTVFKAQIIGTGKVIYDNDYYRSSVFKMRAFKEYALLNEERQCIINKIKENGIKYV